LTSWSVHAERLLEYMLPNLVLIAEAVSSLERRQTNPQTDASERPTHGGGYAGVGKKTTLNMFRKWACCKKANVEDRHRNDFSNLATKHNVTSTIPICTAI